MEWFSGIRDGSVTKKEELCADRIVLIVMAVEKSTYDKMIKNDTDKSFPYFDSMYVVT
jgi:hypothetical protein